MDLSDAPIDLQLYTGSSLSKASSLLSNDLESVELIERVDGPSVFSLTFNVDPPLNADEYPIVGEASLAPFARVAVSVTMSGSATVLADGFVTRQELMPPTQDALGSFVVYGEDVGVMMDLEEKSVEFVNLDYGGIARQILGDYSQYATASVKSPQQQDPTDELRATRLQHSTDRAYLQAIAAMVGHLFYVSAGPSVGKNTAYWGPPELSGSPQTTLASSLLVFSPVSDLHLGYRALSPSKASASVLGIQSTPSQVQAVDIDSSTRTALSKTPGMGQAHLRTRLVRHGGMSVARARLRAQAVVDLAADRTAFASARLDVLEHGTMVRAGKTVSVSGVGGSYGGTWYVRQVVHTVSRGRFEQQIELSREGLGQK